MLLQLHRLELPPNKIDSFIWADYAEFLALVHPDKAFSRGELYGILRRLSDRGKSHKAEERWRLIIDCHQIRSVDYGDLYPFELSDDQDTIYLKNNQDAEKNAYLNLLVASCMRHIPDALRNHVARKFEKFCLEIFRCLMPAGSEVRATWANGGDEAPYIGSLFDKMQAVGRDIRCTPNFLPRDFKKNDNGDGGLDLIAWHPMSDHREGIPISFAQCGCSREDWKFKQFEPSFSKHCRHFPVMHPWAAYYFLPLDLREMDRDWAYKSDIGSAIIVDRLRLLRLGIEYSVLTFAQDSELISGLRHLRRI